ncbi:hypothetical protein MTP99_013627 [Tenebrio molitor]|nr:hypothetical protein MTP99_013627 [Tenebrio molitor]
MARKAGTSPKNARLLSLNSPLKNKTNTSSVATRPIVDHRTTSWCSVTPLPTTTDTALYHGQLRCHSYEFFSSSLASSAGAEDSRVVSPRVIRSELSRIFPVVRIEASKVRDR